MSRRCAWSVIGVMVTAIVAVPVMQSLWEVREYRLGRRDAAMPAAFYVAPLVAPALRALAGGGTSRLHRLREANRAIESEIDRYERDLEDRSVVSRLVLPATQRILSGILGAGNEKVYCGRGGWLFYRQSIDYLTGPGFLSPRHQARRRTESIRPDPLQALLHFHAQLLERGIELMVLPVPVKPAVHPDRFAPGFQPGELVGNPSFDEFRRALEQVGIIVMDIEGMLACMRQDGRETYLRTDTHWRPEAVELAAQAVGSYMIDHDMLSLSEPAGYRHDAEEVTTTGDLAAMLQLPAHDGVYPAPQVRIQRVVTPEGEPWRPSQDSQILILGDSYTNIYSMGALGWGESAGFAAQLSYALQRPVDCIVRNDGGAFATREMLRDEMARGHDRLAGKRVVIYQFSARELAFGDWKLIDLPAAPEVAGSLFCPPPGTSVTVTGTVEAVSEVPRPLSVPYRDHILAVRLAGVRSPGGSESLGQAAVYLWSMRDNELTRAARVRLGQTIFARVRPWSDVSDSLDAFNRSELNELALAPCWGELLE